MWLAQAIEHETLNLRVLSSSPMFKVEPTLKKFKKKFFLSNFKKTDYELIAHYHG